MTALKTREPEALPERRSNRPVRAVHYFEYAIVRIMMSAFQAIGIDRASALAGGFMRFVGPKLRPISKRAENNMREIYPDWSEEKIRAVTADMWENLGRTVGEYAHLDKLHVEGPGARLTYVSDPQTEALLRGERQVIFAAGHFANWETPALLAAELGIDFAVVYRPANNPLVDELIIKLRAKAMNRRMIPKGGRGALALVDTLRRGSSLAMLVDQKLNTGGIAVPLLGKPAMTSPSPARLAVKHDAPIILISARRLDGAHFLITAHAPITVDKSLSEREAIFDVTRKINDALGSVIAEKPGQWLWLHRRWKKKKK